MRRILLGTILIFTLVGCAAIRQATMDARACLADPTCRAEAVAEAKNAKEISVSLAGASPIPLSSNLVGGAVYGIVLLLALIRKRNKKEETPVG